MKYWLLTTEYPPFFGGGIGTYCAITANMLAEKGHEVTVFVCDASVRNYQEEQNEKIRVIRFNTSRTKMYAYLGHVTNISYEFAHIVKDFIGKEGKPDIIEAQEYLGIAYYLLQYKQLLYDWCKDVPVLITMHSPSALYMEYNHVPMYRYPNYWVCEMEMYCLQAADQIVSPSNYMLKELERIFKLDNSNVEIIPNPFEGKINNMLPSDHETPIPGEIVFYGKLTAQKGAFRLLRYFQQLWNIGFDRPLFLLGGQDIVYHPEGISMGDLIRKRYKQFIDRGLLRMEDRIKPSEVSARLARAEVVVVPSDNDNLPYVVFEMMAMGRIILASKQGGQAEVIEHGIDGFIFDHQNPDTFYKQLEHVLQLDKNQRKKISGNAVKKVKEKYSAEAVYEQKIKLLNSLLEKKEKNIRFPFVRNNSNPAPAQTNTAPVVGKLSIVVPYYNMGSYIGETVESLLGCDYSDKEIIIINDGSTEAASIEKLNSFRGHENIKVSDIPNGGLATARNYGAEIASGEFLAFLDADDTVSPSYYPKAIKVLRQYGNVYFVGCWVQYFGSTQHVWPAFMPEPPLILNHNMINSSSLVYKRSSFLTYGKNDPAMLFPGYEDYDSVISLLARGFGGVVLPETLFNYRVRPGSMYRTISKSKKLNLYQHISNKHRQFYEIHSVDLFNLLNANGPGILLDNPTLDLHLADRLPLGGKLSAMAIGLIKRNRFVKTVAYKVYKSIKK